MSLNSDFGFFSLSRNTPLTKMSSKGNKGVIRDTADNFMANWGFKAYMYPLQ